MVPVSVVAGQPVAAVGLRGRPWRGVGATSLRWGPAASGLVTELCVPRQCLTTNMCAMRPHADKKMFAARSSSPPFL